LKLVAGSANAVQEYDIRVWIETWVTPTLQQVVNLEQYYESDEIVLGLVGERAQLFQKHGIDTITDDLLEQQVTVRVSAGLGAGDPQQRLQKFAMAAQIAVPLLAQSPRFQRGELAINDEAVMDEVFGAAGYRDGGKRFVMKGPGQHNPLGDLQAEEMKSKIEKNRQTGKASLLSGLAAVAKVALGNKELEATTANQLLDAHFKAQDFGHKHGDAFAKTHLSALDHGHRHGLALAQHRHEVQQGERDHLLRQAEIAAGGEEASPGGEGETPAPSPASTPDQPPSPSPRAAAAGVPESPTPARPVRYEFIRDHSGRITGAVPIYADQDQGP
jgi:hypothetical protein